MKNIRLVSLVLSLPITCLFTGHALVGRNIHQWPSGSTTEGVDRLQDNVMGFGKWSNVKVSESEDSHASGITVKMWRYRGNLIGYLFEYVGPPSDPPTGMLEDISFNEKTMEISFRAKLSTGHVYSDKDKKWVPAKDIYIFKGTIQPTAIIGDLEKRRVQDDGKEKIVEGEKIELKGELGPADYLENRPYQEWFEFTEKIMKTRGPKW